MFNKFISWIRQVMANMFSGFKLSTGETIVSSAVSDDMAAAVQFWMDLYVGHAPWLTKNKQTMGLPAAIASEIARMVTAEMQVNVSEKDSKRAEYLSQQILPVINKIRRQCEYACAGGGLMMKPYPSDDIIAVDFIKADAFIPLAFNSSEQIIACAFIERKTSGNKIYSRIEKHEFINELYTITNTAYYSENKNDIGRPIPLTDVTEWANLQPTQSLQNIAKPLFAYFKIPMGNTIDPDSPLGVSVYARAVNLIEDVDMQYQRLLWEFEGGELAIDVASDVLERDAKNKIIYPGGKERLFRANEMDSVNSSGENLKTFSPTLRDVSIKNGLNTILQKVEFNTGLAYGTLSDPQMIDKTATEIKASKQRSYSTVTDIQKSLQAAFDDLIYAIDVYATLYKLAPEGKYEASYVWDDSIIVDAETERTRDMQEVREGLMMKYQYRMKWYGESEEEAKAVLETSMEDDTNPFYLS